MNPIEALGQAKRALAATSPQSTEVWREKPIAVILSALELLQVERDAQRTDQCLRALVSAGDDGTHVARAHLALAAGRADLAWRELNPADDLAEPHTYEQPWLAHQRARAAFNLGRADESLRTLLELARALPDYAPVWHSLGTVLRAIGRFEQASDAFDQARRRLGSGVQPRLQWAVTQLLLERPADALVEIEDLVQAAPDDAELRVQQGLCLHMLGRSTQAVEAYRAALEAAPDHALAHYYLGSVLNELMDSAAARHHLERAIELAPDDLDARVELIGLLEQSNQLDAARDALETARKLGRDTPALALEAARLERRRGRHDEALRELTRIDPGQLPPRAAAGYWFERGLLSDRRGDFSDAMRALVEGNRLASASPRRAGLDAAAFPDRCQAIEDWIQSGAPGAEPADSDPPWQGPFRAAFLVGFPRSGTTLLDTILDAHEGVHGIEEKSTVEPVIRELFGSLQGYPRAMPTLNSAQVSRAHQVYASEVERHLRAKPDGLVLDKLPLRILQLPLLLRMFPGAPVLLMVRHPCDVVLSNFMQQYAPNEAFIHFDTLESSARTYDRVMRVWWSMRDLFGPIAHVVRYESLVIQPELELRFACNALGVAFDPATLDADRRLAGRGRIQTNSYQQVAEPIYRRASGRWMSYRKHFEPLREWLEPHVLRWGYRWDGDDPDTGAGGAATGGASTISVETRNT